MVERRGDRAGLHERSTLAQLTACGTAALGSHGWSCVSCGESRVAYNSCRNRFCPACGGAKRAKWLDKLRARILPVTHFHLVFTVPHELSVLMLAHRAALYGLLFRAAWLALRELAADPKHLGAQVGAVLVLHTWGQNLEHHPHIHAVIPGGGLSLDGTRWIAATKCRNGRPYLLPVQVLSRLFRGKFLAGLKQLIPNVSPRLLTALYQKEWVVYSQPPADPRQGPDDILKYLARYVAGAAIGDARLLAHDPTANGGDGSVSFRVKNYRQDRQRESLTLSGVEFTRRFALHILPRGFQRVRYCGLLAHRGLQQRLDHCRELLPATPGSASSTPANDSTSSTDRDEQPDEPRCCPRCQQPTWIRVDLDRRPKLCDVLLFSGFAPPGYRNTS